MTRHSLIEGFFDGACAPHNPGGHGGAGVVVRVDDHLVHSAGVYCGSGSEMSCNVAEYRAVIEVIEYLLAAGLADTARTVRIYGDSQLVVKQLRGEWRANEGLYLPHYERAVHLLTDVTRRCAGSVEVRWIPRLTNAEADALSRQVLEERGIQCRPRGRAA